MKIICMLKLIHADCKNTELFWVQFLSCPKRYSIVLKDLAQVQNKNRMV